MSTGPDVTASFCATLADEWVRSGVTDVIVCPGSRSTPLALAVAAEPGLRVHVHHDERSAGFMAVGIGLATGRPAVVVTTSGTAAVELHPAVVEAHEARVPLIVATADRPPELQGVGAPQTIDQTELYGTSVRWFCEPGVPDDDEASSWRDLAVRSVAHGRGDVPGPVHLNLAFREPLVGRGEPVPLTSGGLRLEVVDPEAVSEDAVAARATIRAGRAAMLEPLVEMASAGRGVIVAGRFPGSESGSEELLGLAERLGWPVIADPASGARRPEAVPTIAAADAFLRDPATADALRPDVVVRVGEALASKVVNGWLEGSGARQILVHPYGARIDPGRCIEHVLRCDLGEMVMAIAAVEPGVDPTWLPQWTAAEAAAQGAIAAVLAAHPEVTEPGVARSVLAALPDGAYLFTSSSMPVRDVEWYGLPRNGVRVLANRGANGIDGVTSSAVGVALATGAPTALLIGDVAFLHDTNGLLSLAARGVDLTIVMIDNDGGGIFSFLPQRSALTSDRFEQLFGTPHGVDLAALAGAHGIPVAEPATAAEVGPAVAASLAAGGARVVLLRTDRSANVTIHDEIHAAVAAALPV